MCAPRSWGAPPLRQLRDNSRSSPGGLHDRRRTPALLWFSPFPWAAASVGGWGNVVNDYFDISVDRVNKPWRPLAKGVVKPQESLALGFLLATLGILLSAFVSLFCALVAAAAVFILFLYSWRLKRSGLPGNLAVAFLSALSIIYGGLASPNPPASLLPALYAFVVILGRELAKGLEDVQGDAAAGIRTVAVVHGPRAAVLASAAVLLTLVAMSPLPALLLGYGPGYLAVALLGVDMPVVYALALLAKAPLANAWRATRVLKISLLMGLVAFLLG
uniref:MFS transporter n=1 Tax=Thermofilum pendens TaxID=2269 RepID=A0A7C3WWE7_THEPE